MINNIFFGFIFRLFGFVFFLNEAQRLYEISLFVSFFYKSSFISVSSTFNKTQWWIKIVKQMKRFSINFRSPPAARKALNINTNSSTPNGHSNSMQATSPTTVNGNASSPNSLSNRSRSPTKEYNNATTADQLQVILRLFFAKPRQFTL